MTRTLDKTQSAVNRHNTDSLSNNSTDEGYTSIFRLGLEGDELSTAVITNASDGSTIPKEVKTDKSIALVVSTFLIQ